MFQPFDLGPVTTFGWPWHGLVVTDPETGATEIRLPSGATIAPPALTGGPSQLRASYSACTYPWRSSLPPPVVASPAIDEQWRNSAVLRAENYDYNLGAWGVNSVAGNKVLLGGQVCFLADQCTLNADTLELQFYLSTVTDYLPDVRFPLSSIGLGAPGAIAELRTVLGEFITIIRMDRTADGTRTLWGICVRRRGRKMQQKLVALVEGEWSGTAAAPVYNVRPVLTFAQCAGTAHDLQVAPSGSFTQDALGLWSGSGTVIVEGECPAWAWYDDAGDLQVVQLSIKITNSITYSSTGTSPSPIRTTGSGSSLVEMKLTAGANTVQQVRQLTFSGWSETFAGQSPPYSVVTATLDVSGAVPFTVPAGRMELNRDDQFQGPTATGFIGTIEPGYLLPRAMQGLWASLAGQASIDTLFQHGDDNLALEWPVCTFGTNRCLALFTPLEVDAANSPYENAGPGEYTPTRPDPDSPFLPGRWRFSPLLTPSGVVGTATWVPVADTGEPRGLLQGAQNPITGEAMVNHPDGYVTWA